MKELAAYRQEHDRLSTLNADLARKLTNKVVKVSPPEKVHRQEGNVIHLDYTGTRVPLLQQGQLPTTRRSNDGRVHAL